MFFRTFVGKRRRRRDADTLDGSNYSDGKIDVLNRNAIHQIKKFQISKCREVGLTHRQLNE
jgi:hypothetical protein